MERDPPARGYTTSVSQAHWQSDCLGCKLFSNYGTTRRENGDFLKKKIKDQVNSWKSGKFLPLTSRPWSLNTYCLPKLWYRRACLDLRVGDSSAIASNVKGWLYQDLLIKPEEILLHRPPSYVGLGLRPVKQKALAGFISTFIQTAANPSFQHNLLHTLLYRKYVLPPYFSEELFNIIRRVKS